MHSGAGRLTEMLYSLLADEADVHVIPTLGQHVPHTPEENRQMFGSIPNERIHAHDWRGGCVERRRDFRPSMSTKPPAAPPIGRCRSVLNRMLMEEPWDLIINVGHVVPHEVLGFANHNKNYFIGLGGKDLICAAHMAAACCGIENNLGNLITPLRACFNRAEDELPRQAARLVRAGRAGPQRARSSSSTPACTSATIWKPISTPPGNRASKTSRCSTSRSKSRLRDARRRVLQHLGGQQGRLSHADGPGRRRRADHHRPGPEAVRRAARRRRTSSANTATAARRA